jgi:hypothetical protein
MAEAEATIQQVDRPTERKEGIKSDKAEMQATEMDTEVVKKVEEAAQRYEGTSTSMMCVERR